METRGQFAMLHHQTVILAEFIKLSQRADAVAFARDVDRLIDWVDVLTATANNNQALRRHVTTLLSADRLVAPELIDRLAYKVSEASKLCRLKYDRHSGTTIAALRAIAMFTCDYWKHRPVPALLPEDVLAPFIPVADLLRARFEWAAVRRLITIQSGPTNEVEVTEDSVGVASLRYWCNICDAAEARHIKQLVLRLFSIRQGIADVERAFSRLRAIDSARRSSLCAHPGGRVLHCSQRC